MTSLGTFANGIIFHKQGFDSGPIRNGVDLLHSFDGPVKFRGRIKRDIGEGKVSFHFLKCHRFSRKRNDARKMGKCKEIIK